MFVTFLFIFGMICNGNEWNFLNSDPNITLHDYISMEPQDGYQVVYDLMKRFDMCNYFIHLFCYLGLFVFDSEYWVLMI